jgi:hypothetical protein
MLIWGRGQEEFRKIRNRRAAAQTLIGRVHRPPGPHGFAVIVLRAFRARRDASLASIVAQNPGGDPINLLGWRHDRVRYVPIADILLQGSEMTRCANNR